MDNFLEIAKLAKLELEKSKLVLPKQQVNCSEKNKVTCLENKDIKVNEAIERTIVGKTIYVFDNADDSTVYEKPSTMLTHANNLVLSKEMQEFIDRLKLETKYDDMQDDVKKLLYHLFEIMKSFGLSRFAARTMLRITSDGSRAIHDDTAIGKWNTLRVSSERQTSIRITKNYYEYMDELDKKITVEH